MMKHRLRVHTGPALVGQIAGKLRGAGLPVICEGTEHVYTECDGTTPEGAAWNLCASLMKLYGTDFGLRPRGL